MRLIWLDLETSGLSAEKHSILEVAVGVADLLLAPVGPVPGEHFVLRFIDEHTYGPKCSIPNVPRRFALGGVVPSGDGPCPACDFAPEARAMHEKSGLLAECGRATTTMGEVEDYLLTLVHGEPERGDDKPTLAGSTVHFDLGFLRVHAPRFAARLSHRCYDVSAVKLFCESLGMPRIPKGNAHRAVDDVMESARHLWQCVDWLSKSPSGRQAEATLSRSTTRGDRNPSVATLPDGSTYNYATKASTDPAPRSGDAPRMHILYEGRALCGLSSEVPAKWPLGHRWVSYQEEDALYLSDCDACKSNFHSFHVGQRREPQPEPLATCIEDPEGRAAGRPIVVPLGEPDAHCATTPDGGCSSTDAECMHQPKGGS
jgi:oligoribonuclease (3'-5' exoribonuclease)